MMKFEGALVLFSRMLRAYNEIVKVKGEALYEKGWLDALSRIYKDEFKELKVKMDEDKEELNKLIECEECG